MKYQIKREVFGDEKSLVDLLKPHDTSTAKFNIKVRAADLRLLDKLAELTGRSRAFLVNEFVEHILARGLQAMAEDDKDSAAVLARHVDGVCGTFDCFSGWSAKVFGRRIYGEDEEGKYIYEQDYYWGSFHQHIASPKAYELNRRIEATKQ